MTNEKRLIDANGVEHALLAVCNRESGIPLAVADWLASAVRNAPTVDAVEVVRCKDCKHMNVVGGGYRWCKAWERIQTMGDDGFCCFGERKDNA